MSDRPPLSNNPTAAALEALTADWSASPQTATFDHHSTPGPNDALLQTIAKAKAEFAPAQFPQLPGLNVVGYIDCGGMGHVYRAEQETPKRTVAVKIATSFNRAGMVTRERFDREIQALAAISHPNIMPIYTAGDWHGFPYYSMRYMPGGPLSKSIPRLAGKASAVAAIMRKVARGLQALHEVGIIHRDLKPHNILLDDNDEPLIADFGLAKWLDGSNSELTMTSSVLGTKYYMPPEQTRGLKSASGPNCDIWAFGIVLYELLVGRRPFHEELPGSIFEQIQNSEPEIPEPVPIGLTIIIRRCLQKRPEDRYPSAAALGADLEYWLEGTAIEPASAPRIPAVAGPKRRFGRPLAIGMTSVLLVGIAMATVAVWPEKKKTIAERLNRGDPVTLIDRGLPENPAALQPGSFAQLGLGVDGYAMLGSANVASTELWRGPIDRPVILSCKCAFLKNLRDDHACVGIVIAHEAFEIDGKNFYSNLQLVQQVQKLKKNNAVELTEIVTLELVTWGDGVNRNRIALQTIQRPWQDEPGDKAAIPWRKFEVLLNHPLIVANWEGTPFDPIQFGGLADAWFPKDSSSRPLEPKRAAGLGVTVQGCDALFCHFTITPYTPDP